MYRLGILRGVHRDPIGGKIFEENLSIADYVPARSLERPGARSVPRRAELDR
ncbi:MAG: hypothetical protein ACE5LD_02645 [Candidatus Bipolaricaulia bacterium]